MQYSERQAAVAALVVGAIRDFVTTISPDALPPRTRGALLRVLRALDVWDEQCGRRTPLSGVRPRVKDE